MSTFNVSRVLPYHRARRPEQEAIVDGDVRLTYAQLDDRVHALAAGLAKLGVGRGSMVAILADNSADVIVQMLAVNRLGGAHIALNWRLHPEELAYILRDAGVSVLITEPGWHETAQTTLEHADVAHVCSHGSELPDGWHDVTALEAAGSGTTMPDAEMEHDDLQRLLYTSGTTSRPKGVMLSHGNLVWNALGQIVELELTCHDRIGLTAPLFHVSGQDVPGWTVLYLGATWVISPSYRGRDIVDLIARERLDGMILASQIIHEILAIDDLDLEALASWRWLIFGGVPATLYHRIQEHLPQVRLIEAFGMTELTNGAAYLDAAHATTKTGSQGRPFPHVDIKVVDEQGNDLPPGEEGELLVRGPKVSQGYWRADEINAATFVDGWFHSGDYARIDEDGYLWFLDRKKDMIKSGGENVASAEIERVIYEHPGVAEAAVVGVPDPHWDEVPKALIVPKQGSGLTDEDLRTHCLDRLGKFKVPKHIELVDTLPRNDSGKVLKRVLRDQEREKHSIDR
jgi:fatty-acyl-CoA synthase